MCNHFLVEGKLRVCIRWMKTRQIERQREFVKVSQTNRIKWRKNRR